MVTWKRRFGLIEKTASFVNQTSSFTHSTPPFARLVLTCLPVLHQLLYIHIVAIDHILTATAKHLCISFYMNWITTSLRLKLNQKKRLVPPEMNSNLLGSDQSFDIILLISHQVQTNAQCYAFVYLLNFKVTMLRSKAVLGLNVNI